MTTVATAALLAAALGSGLDVRGALMAVSRSIGTSAESLGSIAKALEIGVPWHEAWRESPAHYAELADALAAAWIEGASPVQPLWELAESQLENARLDGERAAAELGVRLSIPVTLCFLPAFVLVGIVPLLLAVAGAVAGDVMAGGS